LPYGNGVHDDLSDQPRRTTFRRLVRSGELPPGYATEDDVGLHYIGTELHECGLGRSWRSRLVGRHWGERAIEPRLPA